MAQVTVTIAGKTYRMACDDGQEDHLVGLATRLDGTIDQLRGVFGEIGDQRLTVMSAITVLDQLSETERRLRALEGEVETLKADRGSLVARQNEVEDQIAARIITAASRLDQLAHALAGQDEAAE
ncbi:cell division protein ZapA [Chthonobacter albigriseus]|uniref:cell division protein ZapA n=1 Tax=Chthonobacter albigriseus TaxID=1683161 RepID=UPI0015EF9530|nr:cell division protein ZapA [Chthonobacter albigriseus]